MREPVLDLVENGLSFRARRAEKRTGQNRPTGNCLEVLQFVLIHGVESLNPIERQAMDGRSLRKSKSLAKSGSGMKAQLFVTCLVDSLFPEVGESVVELLERAGIDVEFPEDQTCCGQPAFNAGYRDEARRMALHTLKVFEETDGPVVIPSGSCAAMVKHGYPELFVEDAVNLHRAEALAERTYEFSQFLVDVLGVGPAGQPDAGKVAYHPACHGLRMLNVDRQPKQLLHTAGFKVHPLDTVCCGFGGVFAIDQPEISGEMLARKIEEIRESGADTVVACDVSCLMHIEGGLRRAGSQVRCAHIAQTLAGKELGLR